MTYNQSSEYYRRVVAHRPPQFRYLSTFNSTPAPSTVVTVLLPCTVEQCHHTTLIPTPPDQETEDIMNGVAQNVCQGWSVYCRLAPF